MNDNPIAEPISVQLKKTQSEKKDISKDLESAKVLTQAIKDDQALAPIANHIHVSVKDGDITLDGKVDTKDQMNLASNTAKAVGVVDEIHNHIKVSPQE